MTGGGWICFDDLMTGDTCGDERVYWTGTDCN